MATITQPSSVRIHLPYAQIAALCERYGVRELAVFGSVLREDFGPESDIDFLVRFRNDDYGPWLGKLSDLQDELTALLGRRVELTTRPSVDQSDNYIRRKDILDSARVIYEAR